MTSSDINDIVQRVQDQEEEAVALSDRLAGISSTASPAQLRQMLERYETTLRALEEADDAWLRTLEHNLHASSV